MIPHSEIKRGLKAARKSYGQTYHPSFQATKVFAKIYFFSWKQNKSCQGPTSGLWEELMTISYLECVKWRRIWAPRDLEPDDPKHADQGPKRVLAARCWLSVSGGNGCNNNDRNTYLAGLLEGLR